MIRNIKKAINILSEGKSINYEGATGVEFDKVGDTLGSFLEVLINYILKPICLSILNVITNIIFA